MNLPTLDISDIEKYITITRARGGHTISILSKLYKHFETVYANDIGKELLASHVEKLEALLMKIYQETATPQEWAEFRVLKSMMEDEVRKIKVYLDKMNEVKRIAITQ